MAGSRRCPNCGGLNPVEAEWCGQCLQRFVARTPPPPPPPAAGGTSTPTAGAVTVKRAGAFTVTEAGITWTCSRCDGVNPLDAPACSVCGTTFADSMRPPIERPARDPNTVAMYSLFFPGAGHWYLGMKGVAVARGILSLWVLTVTVLAVSAGSLGLAAMFGLAAFALWATAAHDAFREANGQSQLVLLKSRIFVYVVLGLLTLMIVMLVSAGLRAGR